MTIENPEYFENQDPTKPTSVGGDIYVRIDQFDCIEFVNPDTEKRSGPGWMGPVVLLNILNFYVTHRGAESLSDLLTESSKQKTSGQLMYQPLFDAFEKAKK